MEPELQPIAEQIDGFWMQLMQQANNLWLPSRQLQLAVLVGCILVAYLLVKWVRPKYRGWMRTLAGRPKWQLRALLLIERRLGLILFAALVWGGAFAIAQFTPFTSRRYILELIGTISIAIIAVGFLVRLVHNPLIQAS